MLMGVSLSIGTVSVPMGQIINYFTNQEVPQRIVDIIVHIRLPRIIGAYMCGCALAMAGLLLKPRYIIPLHLQGLLGSMQVWFFCGVGGGDCTCQSIFQIFFFVYWSHGRFPRFGFSKTLAKYDLDMIAYAAEVTGVEKLLKKDLWELSGGERQRAYIAMAVAQETNILLLDEPANHLDIATQLEIMDLLSNLYQKGKTIVMASHDLPQAFTYATKIYLIHEGAIKIQGKPLDIYHEQIIQGCFHVYLEQNKDPDAVYKYYKPPVGILCKRWRLVV